MILVFYIIGDGILHYYTYTLNAVGGKGLKNCGHTLSMVPIATHFFKWILLNDMLM